MYSTKLIFPSLLTTPLAAPVAAVLLAAASGCTDELKTPPIKEKDGSVEAVNTCHGKEAGDSCGNGVFCITGECKHNVCGDGVQLELEECDDGNAVLGDECSPACKLTPATCGNGKLEDKEECDDGNKVSADACSNSCTKNECGNHRHDPGEECDDGNTIDSDYCSNGCTQTLCGNSKVDPGEECDDGNTDNKDGCTLNCQILKCGDGEVERDAGALTEECDDGNQVDNDNCSNKCTVNQCGNARLDPGETCDGIAGLGDAGVGLACAPDCSGLVDDTCDKCTQEKCRRVREDAVFPKEVDGGIVDVVFDWYEPCREQATGVNPWTGDGPYYDAFTADCTAYDKCLLSKNCLNKAKLNDDLTSAILPCICAGTFTECLEGKFAIDGPCGSEAIRATGCASVEGPKNNCVVGTNFTDFVRPSGVAYTLIECRYQNCRSECFR